MSANRIRAPLAALDWLGRQTVKLGDEVGYASALLFESLYWLVLGHWRNQPVRASAIFKEAVEVGVRAIPIVCIACFATGTMLAMQGILEVRPDALLNRQVILQRVGQFEARLVGEDARIGRSRFDGWWLHGGSGRGQRHVGY